MNERLVYEADIDSTHGVGGAIWSLPHTGDLDGNLVRLAPGRSIDEHRNDEVDVLVVVRDGGGELAVDGDALALGPSSLALVPRGATRSVTAGPDGISYLSVHRHRGPLRVGHAAETST